MPLFLHKPVCNIDNYNLQRKGHGQSNCAACFCFFFLCFTLFFFSFRAGAATSSAYAPVGCAAAPVASSNTVRRPSHLAPAITPGMTQTIRP